MFPDFRGNRGRGSRGLSDVEFAAATVAPGGLDRVLVGLFEVIGSQPAEDSRNQCQLGRKLLSSALLDNRNRVPGHLLEFLEAGVGLEGLGDCSTAHFAEVVVVQAAEESRSMHELERK